MEQGQYLRQRYRIIERLRQGPSSTIYLAMDEKTREIVAVKVFGGIGQYAGFQRRFRENAEKLTRIEGQDMVRMFDFGFENDRSYMVTQYVPGKTLAEIISERSRLPTHEALGIALQVTKALSAIRQNVSLHGMLNPLSVIQNNQHAYILDYDIATAVLVTEGAGAVSREVARYQSPEQIEEGKKLSSHSDIYSLGVMLFEMISGRVPYDGDNSGQIVSKHLEAYVPSLSLYVPDVPEDASDLVEQCLQKSPSSRPKSYSALLSLIAKAMSVKSSHRRGTSGEPPRSSSESREDSGAILATLTSVEGKIYKLPAGQRIIRIGRRDSRNNILPDVDLGEEDRDRHVSRRHAQIIVDAPHCFLVEETGARSPTKVNGKKLNSGDRVLLKDKDKIGIAEIELTFHTYQND